MFAEQLRARKTPKQAVPLFLPKLLAIARHINSRILDPKNKGIDLFIFAHDQAVLKILFFGGDLGSDLGIVKTSEILGFPGDDGFIFNHIWGKSLRDWSSNMFGIRRHPNPLVCPVAAVESDVKVCGCLGIDILRYLFRPTTPQNGVVNKPLVGNTIQQRLKHYLKEMNLDEGESVHSLRAGCAITLALSGAQLADIMSHVGWKNNQTALHHMKLSEVLRQGSPSSLLSSETGTTTAVEAYKDLNSLKDFTSAFPISQANLPGTGSS